MFTKKIYNYIDYHIGSRNPKYLIDCKTDHLTHYRSDIVKIQGDVELSGYTGEEIRLGKEKDIQLPIDEVFEKRSSSRNFSKKLITRSEISTLLRYSVGNMKSNPRKKYTPSSGGFQSVSIFPIILNAEDIDKGIYYYDTQSHSMKLISKGDYSEWLDNHIYYQTEWSNASVIFVLASDIGRLAKKYHARAYRLSLLDVGHVSQNVYLTATGLGLQVCACGGYIDSELDQALHLDGVEQSSLLTIAIGK